MIIERHRREILYLPGRNKQHHTFDFPPWIAPNQECQLLGPALSEDETTWKFYLYIYNSTSTTDFQEIMNVSRVPDLQRLKLILLDEQAKKTMKDIDIDIQRLYLYRRNSRPQRDEI